jgi:hypothetical protein
MSSTFGLAFSISHFIFSILIFLGTYKIKGQMSDEELLIIPSRLCHFLMCEYISSHGWFRIPDGHMAQFPTLCDYIEQGQAK